MSDGQGTQAGSFAELEDVAALEELSERHWRLEQDQRPLSLRASLVPMLKKQPAPWVAGIARALAIKAHGKTPQITEIGRTLADPFSLTHIVERLPAVARRVLKTVLNRDGWVPYAALVQTFGDDSGDGWFWAQNPPASPIGVVRLHGLLFVGTITRNAHTLAIALIPREVREALTKILSQEDDTELATPSRDMLLEAVLKEVSAYFNEIDDDSLITREQVRVFLTAASLHDETDVRGIWADLEFFIFYLAHLAEEIRGLDDLRDYHVSEFAHQFIESTIRGHVTQQQKRALLAHVAQLIEFLGEQGALKASTQARVREATAIISANRRSLAQIDRPMPLGGEPVLRTSQDGHLVTFTFNDLWLGLAAIAEHKGDLMALHDAARGVPDGAVKRKRINWLMRRDLGEFNEVLSAIPSAALQAAVEWFHHAAFNRGSAWAGPIDDDT